MAAYTPDCISGTYVSIWRFDTLLKGTSVMPRGCHGIASYKWNAFNILFGTLQTTENNLDFTLLVVKITNVIFVLYICVI